MGFSAQVASRSMRARSLSRFLSFMTMTAVGSVAVGTAALIITFCILDGFERELRSVITGVSGHIQVGTFGNAVVAEDHARLERLKAVGGVTSASPFLQREAVVITRDDIDGVLVKGVTEAGGLQRRIKQGVWQWRHPDRRPSVVMGERLAQRLGLGVGDRILLLGMKEPEDALAAPKVQCVIRGLYETGMAEYFDDLMIFTSIQTAQRLFDSPAVLNGYDVRCSDPADVNAVAGRAAVALGYPFDVRSVFDIYRNLFVWIDLQKDLVPIVVGSLILISAFNVISTLLLFVIEKTSSIGILLALGASRRSIRGIYLFQGAIVGLAGAALGSLAALGLLAAQAEFRFFSLPPDVYYMTTVPIRLSVESFAIPMLAATALSILSATAPAWLASRLNPVASIRFH